MTLDFFMAELCGLFQNFEDLESVEDWQVATMAMRTPLSRSMAPVCVLARGGA